MGNVAVDRSIFLKSFDSTNYHSTDQTKTESEWLLSGSAIIHNSPFCRFKKKNKTRKHSSRVCTTLFLITPRGIQCMGGGLSTHPLDIPTPGEGEYPPLDTPGRDPVPKIPLPCDTPVKTLPSCNFLCGR